VVDIGKFIDLKGEKFGRLTVIEKAENRGNYVMWYCECDCGKDAVISSIHLRDGQSKSCGCLRKELARDNQTKHGMSNTRFYRIWKAMISRCTNPKDRCYDIYGGKGVSVCDEWLGFIAFRNDMLESYNIHSQKYGEENTSIDRIDSDGDYILANCRWATNLEQARNTSSKSGHKGVQRSSDDKKWIANIGINYKLVHLGSFDSLEDAITARKEAEKTYWG
jgi:hypothetical protein